MDCSLPGSSVHGILQARVLEWFAISFSSFRMIRSQKILVFTEIQNKYVFNKLMSAPGLEL